VESSCEENRDFSARDRSFTVGVMAARPGVVEHGIEAVYR
jgi:hypothetical protein